MESARKRIYNYMIIRISRDSFKGKKKKSKLQIISFKNFVFVSIQLRQQNLTLALHSWMCSVYSNISPRYSKRQGKTLLVYSATYVKMTNTQGQIWFPPEWGKQSNISHYSTPALLPPANPPAMGCGILVTLEFWSFFSWVSIIIHQTNQAISDK